ncbi:TPA: phage gp6-like head-tail connector protein [Yersinia enterocolitica]|nr:phage gp6-like head-tail connector protein [Yersinia enterocolitica]HDL8138662.1 phage gp6-like head-tail connector protein [Yersinia enterocolitica]HDW2134500.1 phage gp6-like head-tail connector protein [Yersinia enterocolitica]
MLELDKVKHHCNIEPEFTEDDAWLEARIKAGERFVENYTRRKLYAEASDEGYSEEDGLLYEEDIDTAILLLIGHWYTNREATVIGVTSKQLEFTVDSLLQPYRIYGV